MRPSFSLPFSSEGFFCYSDRQIINAGFMLVRMNKGLSFALPCKKLHDVVTSFSPQNKCVMKDSSNSISTALIPTIPLDYQEYPIEEVQRRSLEY